MGPALQPFRDDVVLACKTLEREAEGAKHELEDSLRKLKTDHFDLYQLHAMTTREDYEAAMGSGRGDRDVDRSKGGGEDTIHGVQCA